MNETTKENINRCLVKIKKDDPYAGEELHGIVSSSLRHIALKYLHNEQDADDLIQDFWADIFNIARNFYFVTVTATSKTDLRHTTVSPLYMTTVPRTA